MNVKFPPKTEYASLGLAVSGGADSVALLLWCLERRDELPPLTVYTFNHLLRGEEGEKDALFVQNLCLERGVPCRSFLLPVKAYAQNRLLSVEAAARELRRAVLEEAVARGEVAAVATAHHAGDQAETVLFRLLRGTGVSGAAGIRPVSGVFLHPMLSVTKAEILEFLATRKAEFRRDETNDISDFSRNFLRNELLPLAESRFPAAAENLARFATAAEEDDLFLQSLAEKYLAEDGTVLPCDAKPLLYRAAKKAMARAGLTADYARPHLEAIGSLFERPTGTKEELPHGFFAYRTARGIKILPPLTDDFHIPFQEGILSLPCGSYRAEVRSTPPRTPRKGTFWVDAEKIPTGAFFRQRREGDRFRPFGHASEKKVKDFLADQKSDAGEKARAALLTDGTEIFAVLPYGISDGVKCDESTCRVLIFTPLSKEGGEDSFFGGFPLPNGEVEG